MRCINNTEMNVKRTILFLTAAALLTGCFKDVSTTTNYVIKPLVQDLSGDPYLALEGGKSLRFRRRHGFLHRRFLCGCAGGRRQPEGQSFGAAFAFRHGCALRA